MKIKLLTASIITGLIISPVYADMFILHQADYNGMDNYVGQRCSQEGKILIKCDCTSPGLSLSTCAVNNDVLYNGCRLEGGEEYNENYFCVDAYLGMICSTCRCYHNESVSAWQSIGNNRVSRSTYTMTDSGYKCISSASTEYGCAAGYYKYSGSGSSMNCQSCPPSGSGKGSSSTGNTAITGCYMPAGSFSESTGSGVYTANCPYKV